MKLAEALHGVSSIFLDTAPIIYHMERNPHYADIMDSFFRIRAARGITLVTSPVTLSECLVHTIKQNRPDLEKAYHDLIVVGENTVFSAIGSAEAREAARLRAEHNLRLGDSFQAAVGILAGCQGILTNDPIFKRVEELPAFVLTELEA